jgi:hypothetical protein
MFSMQYLCSFRPLAESELGREAAEQFHLPLFVDASCRREPDFESKFPSITALCRCGHFAPRLRVGDMVVYITRKARYFNAAEGHWRLVAILKILASFESHAAAADWYRAQDQPLPSNCMMPGNPPLALEMTDRHFNDLRHWDAIYRLRAKTWGVFHVCEPLFCELQHPPAVTEAMMRDIFGRIPGTLNPPAIADAELAKLHELANKATHQTGT